MRWLFIDACSPQLFRFGIVDSGKISLHTFAGRSNGFLAAIHTKYPLSVLSSLDGICVVRGPGSFTSVRTGVLMANVFARILRVPLVSLGAREAQDISSVAKRLEQNAYPAASLVLPEYDAAPDITLSPPPPC